jgi:uncharacterized membrane protein
MVNHTINPHSTTNPHSTAKIADHPLHPMLVSFPIALFTLTLVSDIIFSQTANSFWAVASFWLLSAGLVMAALAAVMGVIDFLGERRIRAMADAWMHAAANVAAVLLSVYNLYLRYPDPVVNASTGLLISGAVVLLLLFSGWKGGNLVYRYHVGVSDTPDDNVSGRR